jgi:monoamine oxidase
MKLKKVIVIGSGFAGLAAANTLMDAGVEVLVLEARPVSGGRIITNQTLGVPIDLGAFIIHGITDNPITEFCDKLGLKYEPLNFKSRLAFDKDNHVISPALIEEYYTAFENIIANIDSRKMGQADLPLAEAIHKEIQSGTYTEVEKENFAMQIMLKSLYFGMELKYLSTVFWDAEDRMLGEECLVVSGYFPIIEYLQQGLIVRHNCAVTKIDYEQPRIKVLAANEEMEADAVIVTVPVSILKNNAIEFIPPLPVKKTQAIKNVGMGYLNKIIMLFPAPFWPAEYTVMTSLQTFEDIAVFFNYFKFTQANILMGTVAGEHARSLEAKSDAEMTKLMLSALKKLFGDKVPTPEAVVITRWHQEPHIEGSYSYLPPGSTPDDYDDLAQPLAGKIFFAGEATHRTHAATTHGAYWSGQRAAEEVLAEFNSMTREPL